MSKTGNAMLAICEQAIARTAEVVEPHNPERVAAFAHKLRGLGNLKVAEALELVPGLRVPGDFRHARYTRFEVIERKPSGELVLGEGRYGGEVVSPSLEAITMERIVCHGIVISMQEDCTSNGQGEWVETLALPIIDPGVLELGLVLLPRGTNDWFVGDELRNRDNDST